MVPCTSGYFGCGFRVRITDVARGVLFLSFAMLPDDLVAKQKCLFLRESVITICLYYTFKGYQRAYDSVNLTRATISTRNKTLRGVSREDRYTCVGGLAGGRF